MNCTLGNSGVPSYEDTCSFTCKTGYELTGSDSRTCQSNGSWSGSQTMCNCRYRFVCLIITSMITEQSSKYNNYAIKNGADIVATMLNIDTKSLKYLGCCSKTLAMFCKPDAPLAIQNFFKPDYHIISYCGNSTNWLPAHRYLTSRIILDVFLIRKQQNINEIGIYTLIFVCI